MYAFSQLCLSKEKGQAGACYVSFFTIGSFQGERISRCMMTRMDAARATRPYPCTDRKVRMRRRHRQMNTDHNACLMCYLTEAWHKQMSTRLPVQSTCARDTHRQLHPFDAPGARHHGHTANFHCHVPSQHMPQTETRHALLCLLRMMRSHSLLPLRMVRLHTHGTARRRQTQQQERTGGLIKHNVRRRDCHREVLHTGVPQRVPARYVRHRATQEFAHADVP